MVAEIHRDVVEIRKGLHTVSMEGCAKREGDVSRIVHIEDTIKGLGQKMDKIFYATLVTAGGIIAFLLKAFLPFIIK